MAQADPVRRRRATGGLLALLVVGCVFGALHQTRWGYDDAFISYRYAEHLAQGHGPVFNPGERVEGYSNALYVGLMALAHLAVPRDAIYATSVALNVACLAFGLVALLRTARRHAGEGPALVAGSLFALSPFLWKAAWSGLETCLVVAVFVVLAGALRDAQAGDRRAAAIAWPLVLLGLARADGFVIASVVVAYLAFRCEWRLTAWAALAGGGTWLLQTLARLAYYGVPLPNTAYAKVTGPLGERLAFAAASFQGFFALHPYLLLLVGLALWRVWRRRQGASAPVLDFATFFAGAWLLYWFVVGGDIFGMRFLLVLLPLGYLALAELLARTAALRPLVAAWLVALVALPFASDAIGRERVRYDPWIALGRFLGEHHPGATIAVDGAGKVPYHARLPAIDMLGLADAHIARTPARNRVPGHGKYDADYVLGRRPDLVCALVANDRFDLGWGLDAARYRRAGYRLVYLQHFEPGPDTPAIVDASGLPTEARRALYARGYRYAVLAQRGRDD